MTKTGRFVPPIGADRELIASWLEDERQRWRKYEWAPVWMGLCLAVFFCVLSVWFLLDQGDMIQGGFLGILAIALTVVSVGSIPRRKRP